MTKIAIKCIESWMVTHRYRYCAERGNGEEPAFGETPRQALERLEAREASSVGSCEMDLAAEVAFLTLGAYEAAKDQRRVDLSIHDGYMGFIENVICHAPMLARRWRAIERKGFDGVWLYDVTARFGQEWAKVLLRRSSESPEEILELIIDGEQGK